MRALLGVVAAAALAAGCSSSPAEPPPAASAASKPVEIDRPAVDVGEVGILQAPDEGFVAIAKSVEAAGELHAARQKRSIELLRRLLEIGDVFAEDEGSAVLVVRDGRDGRQFVRVLVGTHARAEGWVEADQVVKFVPPFDVGQDVKLVVDTTGAGQLALCETRELFDAYLATLGAGDDALRAELELDGQVVKVAVGTMAEVEDVIPGACLVRISGGVLEGKRGWVRPSWIRGVVIVNVQ